MTDIGKLYAFKDQQFISIVYYNLYDNPKKLINEKPWIGEFVIKHDLDHDDKYMIELKNEQKMVCSIGLLKADLLVGEEQYRFRFRV